jgi:hypothetical protein
MDSCPICKNELIAEVNPKGVFPRSIACKSCGYPLSVSTMFERLANSSITEVARGSIFGDEVELLSAGAGLSVFREGMEEGYAFPALEDVDAIVVTVMDIVLIFNLGAPGGYRKYLRTWS